ncbi:M1 family metallopeptidase [Pseudarthrobacter sp. J1738]|uniref:M1 family metallopeptidase n=1 Tax=Pseudarthrobacter sp. J1738 TaxID=3420446 RepID=UPI003D2E4FCC
MSTSSTNTTQDSYTPEHGSTVYSVDHYDLDLDYKLASNKLSAKATLYATAGTKTQSIVLDLVGLKVLKVQLDGRPIQKFSQRRAHLVIVPKDPIAKGQEFRLDIRYEGNPRPRTGLWGEVGWEELTDGVLVAGQPDGAASWFPCNDHPSQKASYRIAVTTDDNYRAVCNGKLVRRTSKSSRETWVYEQREPMATYLATVQIGRYNPVELPATQDSSSPVRQVVAVPAELRGEALTALAEQPRMMDVFQYCFGPYPFSEYGVVVTQDELEIPLEAQGMSIIGRNHLSTSWEAQRLIAHELSHQWFGNSLTLNRWKDIWLHEGFACYAEWVWSEAAGVMTATQRATEAWKKLSGLPQDIRVGDPGPELMFDDRVYKRGALALHALRVRIGEEQFFPLLQEWVARFRHGNVSTEDFVKLAVELVPGLKAAELLEPWLYAEKLPKLP